MLAFTRHTILGGLEARCEIKFAISEGEVKRFIFMLPWSIYLSLNQFASRSDKEHLLPLTSF